MAAAARRLPNLALRSDAACVTTLSDVVQSPGSTPHSWAAAATSIARAVAPALRIRSHSVRTLVLPPTIWMP